MKLRPNQVTLIAVQSMLLQLNYDAIQQTSKQQGLIRLAGVCFTLQRLCEWPQGPQPCGFWLLWRQTEVKSMFDQSQIIKIRNTRNTH